MIQGLRGQFKGSDYNLLTQNCNHFANALVVRILGREIPPFVNRMAYYGSFFSCLLPSSATGAAPVDQGGNTSSSNSSGSDSGSSFGGGYVGRSSARLGSSSSKSTSTTTAFSGTGRKLGMFI